MSAQPKALELADSLERRYSGCHADENDFLEMDAAAELRRLHAKVDALECKVDDLEWENKGIAEWRHEWSLMTNEFKNFHRVLCERFDYTHDNIYWRRDQVSLIEWIAKQPPAAPAQEQVRELLRDCRWRIVNKDTSTDDYRRLDKPVVERIDAMLAAPAQEHDVSQEQKGIFPDYAAPAQTPVAWADKIAFQDAISKGKGCDVWPSPGDYEKRTGRDLVALCYATQVRRSADR